jgi:hypothetical protein
LVVYIICFNDARSNRYQSDQSAGMKSEENFLHVARKISMRITYKFLN